MGSYLGGAGTNAQNSTDLGEGKTERVMENEHLASIRCEQGERRRQYIARGEPLELWRHVHVVHRGLFFVARTPRPGAAIGLIDVTRDRERPRPKRPRGLISVT